MSDASIAFARVTTDPLSLDEHYRAVTDPRFGAVVCFTGRIRNHDPDAAGEVQLLEYSSHPDAERIINEIAREVATPEVRLAVSHRIGPLPVGELALVSCVASAHRDDAYTVSRQLVEAIKVSLPIWKRQIEADGTAGWIGIE